MPIQQKKRFLVWALTVAVFKESSCDPNAKAKGPHGIAKGWLQLHDGKEQNYPPVKGVRKCQKGSSRHPVTTIDCFYRMASYYVPANGGTLFVEKQPNKRPPTYWDVFLSNSKAGKSTRKMMSAYKGCK